MILSKVRVALDLVVICVFAWSLSEAIGFPRLAGQFPILVAVGGLTFGAIGLARDVHQIRTLGTALGGDVMDTASLTTMVSDTDEGDQAEAGLADAFRAIGRYTAWIVAYVASVWILGLAAASALFVAAFLLREAQFGLVRAALAAAVVWGGLMFLSDLLSAPWPHTIWS